MEGGGFNLFGGGDPEEFLRAMQEAMERAGEQQMEVQSKHFAQETLDSAIELTSAALGQINAAGTSEEQALAIRDAMRVLFPEAVALVSAARQGLMRDA